MVKNQQLPMNIVTPTTKEKTHDRPISLEDIVKEGWMEQEDLDYCAAKTLEVIYHIFVLVWAIRVTYVVFCVNRFSSLAKKSQPNAGSSSSIPSTSSAARPTGRSA